MNIEPTEFALSVSHDRLAVLLDCIVPQAGLDLLLDKIEGQFTALKVAGFLDRKALEEKLAQARTNGGQLAGERLAQGVPPIPPQDAVLKWAGEFFGSGFAVDKTTGRIDYRRRAAQPAVDEGQLLAMRTPALEGTPGADVFGKRIPVTRPNRIRLRVGPNVREEEKDGIHHYYATAGGRVRWASNVLAVDTVLTIAGDVGLETGDILHHGAVVIQGDVLAGSRMEAQGNIDVHGSIEPADIHTGGDLHVDQGITGSGGHKIIVDGAVHAKYLMDAEIEAGEDIVIESEIIHCILKTRGRLHMPNGRLIGGEVVALKGIDLGEAGSTGKIPTRLVAGVDCHLVRELKSKDEELARQKGCLEKIHTALALLTSRQKTLSPQQRETLTEMYYEEANLVEAIECLQQEIQDLKTNSQDRARSRITVKERLFPETTLCLENETITITDDFRGPLHAISVNGQIHLHSMDNEDFQP